MDFLIYGTRTTTTTTTVVERLDGIEVSLSKKNVMKFTGCAAVEDGDSSAWYGHAEEAILYGAPHKTNKDIGEIEILESSTEVEYFWDHELFVDVT